MSKKRYPKCVTAATLHLRPPNERGGIDITQGQWDVIDWWSERWGMTPIEVVKWFLQCAIVDKATVIDRKP